jgi:hypothetical protein
MCRERLSVVGEGSVPMCVCCGITWDLGAFLITA